MYSQSAPAKINLALDVLGPRPDGYHEMRMVMQSVSLQDQVTIRETPEGFRLLGMDLPEGVKTLEQRAAEAFFAVLGRPAPGLEVRLEKRTPAYAGLGGGSADVAAVLRLLREMYCPEMDPAELEAIGLTVGSDVPFCVRGGAALAEGRGERLTDLPPLPPCWLVIAKPAFDLPTPEMFRRLHSRTPSDGPDVNGMAGALRKGDLHSAAARMGNVFESVLEPPEQREVLYIKNTLCRFGALNAVMSGSGPSVVGIFTHKEDASAALDDLRNVCQTAALAQPMGRLI